jgi:aconitase B
VTQKPEMLRLRVAGALPPRGRWHSYFKFLELESRVGISGLTHARLKVSVRRRAGSDSVRLADSELQVTE